MNEQDVIAFLNVDGYPIAEVISCFYEFRRSVDQKGRPSSITQGGVIKMEIISTKDTVSFFKWITDPFMEMDGVIEFYDITKQPIKTVSYKNAKCIGYAERYDKILNRQISNNTPFSLTLTISAEIVSIAGSEYHNNWDNRK